MADDAVAAQADQERRQQERIKKQVRHLKGDSRSYQEQIQKDIRRLGIEKENLRKDNERLKQDINQHMAPSLGALPEKSQRLASKNKEIEHKKQVLALLEKKLEMEQRKSRTRDRVLEQQADTLSKARGDAKEKNSKTRPDWVYEVIPINATQEAHQRIERQVKVLENRLDKALVRFNEALHVNKELREQIDNLQGEREVFDTIYKRLEQELQEKKKEMAFIIEVSNIAYEEKDNAISELEQLKLYAKKEMESFEETFKELDELLEEDRKMKEAIRLRMAERKEKQPPPKSPEDDAKKKRITQAGSTKQSQTITSPTSSSAQPPQDGQMTLAMYEEAFQKIRMATSCEDISKLVTTFLHSEDDNFSLFNYVNELNSEVDKLEEDRNELIKEIEKAKGNVGNHGELQRQKVLKQLEQQLKEAENQNYKYREKLEQTNKILDEIMIRVEVTFAALDCPPDKIINQCGWSEKGAPAVPNTSNLLLYLAAIELRADEYLRAWARQESREGIPPGLLRGPAQPFGQAQIQIDIPNTGEDFNDDDDDDEGTHVMTREELIEKSLKRIRQQQQTQADKGKFGGTKWGKQKQGRK